MSKSPTLGRGKRAQNGCDDDDDDFFFSDLHPKCSVMVTHVTIYNILFSGQMTFDIENKDSNLRVYQYRTAKVCMVCRSHESHAYPHPF